MTHVCRNGFIAMIAVVLTWSTPTRADEPTTHRIRLTITSDLNFPRVPIDPRIDFAAVIRKAKLPGVLNPNSIRVVDAATGEVVPCAVTEDFAYGDAGRIEWVVTDPAHKVYEIRFQTADKRPPMKPAAFTPMIGVGDLLRYNAGEPRPITLAYPSGLIDLTGDGRRDLVGCWNYAYRPGWPWDGVICYPRAGADGTFLFGDLVRARYVSKPDATDFHFLSRIYMHAAFADLNKDGRVDMIYSPNGGSSAYVYFNSGRRDTGGMPVFVAAGAVSRQTSAWGPCRAVDLNGDGAIDLVVGNVYLRNTNAEGWPLEFAKGVPLDAGKDADFLDVNGDGKLDAVCKLENLHGHAFEHGLAWRANVGGDPPRFGPPRPLPGADLWWPSYVAAVREGTPAGLLVVHDVFQSVSFIELARDANGEPCFRRVGRALSLSAVMSLSDQAWPCICDWDSDGDADLLVGGGYGWPRIVLNEGTSDRPAYAEPRFVIADGKPVRILRNQILGGENWHDMGYTYPAFVDWDGDGLGDILLPNETNRIFWYKNVGTKTAPVFAKRQQVVVDGYPDSVAARFKSSQLAGDKSVPNAPYPYQKDRPFFWRTGAAFADINGDGLVDLMTHDGHVRKLTLFERYRDDKGRLRLKKGPRLKLKDGRAIDDAIVGRGKHWTESFRCADWDGDGLTDIVYACAGTAAAKGSIYLLRNCGSKTEPVFEPPRTFCCFGKPIKVTSHGPHPAVGDLDGDGKCDLLTCVEWSVYPFYTHAAIEMTQRPTFELGGLIE